MNETNVNQNNSNSTTDSSKFNYQESKGPLKAQFSRLSESDLKAIEMNPESAATRIQNAYGYSKEKAIEEFNNFKSKNKSKSSGTEKINGQPATQAQGKNQSQGPSSSAAGQSRDQGKEDEKSDHSKI